MGGSFAFCPEVGNARPRSCHRIWQLTLKGVNPRPALGSNTDLVDPFERRLSIEGRLVTRREALAQAAIERAVELVIVGARVIT